MASIINATTTNGVAVQGDNSGSLQLQTNNGTTAVTIDTSQNVGIGTTTPTSTSGGTTLAVKSSTHANMVGEVTTTTYSAIWEGRRTGRSTASRFAQVNLNVDSSDNGNIIFYTAPVSNDITERMRIDSNGNLFVGASSSALNSTRFLSFQDSNASAITARCTSTSQGSDVILARASRNTTNGSFQAITYYNDGAGAYKFIVADSGNVTNTNGSYGTISDAKLKENIVDATPKLDKLNQLKVRNYNLIGDDLKQIGFVAQEFEQVFPSMVEESQDRTPDGEMLGTTTKTIKTTVLIPILVKAIQELKAELDATKAEVQALKGVA